MVTTKAVRGGEEPSFANSSSPPLKAVDALEAAEKALDEALAVEVLDLVTGRTISFAELRKVANTQGI